jgi:hypothetical protein
MKFHVFIKYSIKNVIFKEFFPQKHKKIPCSLIKRAGDFSESEITG